MLFMGIVASAAIAMTGCSSDETVLTPSAQGNAIEFGTYLGRDAQMRGTVMDNDALKNMGVYASYTEQKKYAEATDPTSNFMYNQKVVKNGTNWEYSPLKYWPTTQNDKVSFFAYAPYTTESNNVIAVESDNAAKNAPTLTVTLPDDLKNMVDFVAGVQMDKTYPGTGDANTAVKFTLKHELTRVGIQAKVNQNVYGTDAKNKTKVVITDIQLDGLANGQFYQSGVYTFPTSESAVGTWSNQTARTEAFDLNTLQTKTNYKVGTGYNKDGIILEGTTAKSLFTAGQYLFLIPASTTGLTTENTVTITYDIVTTDAALAGGCSVTHAVKTVKIPANTLKQGTAYTLTFTINVDEVKLDAEVSDWATATGDVSVDYKDTDK